MGWCLCLALLASAAGVSRRAGFDPGPERLLATLTLAVGALQLGALTAGFAFRLTPGGLAATTTAWFVLIAAALVRSRPTNAPDDGRDVVPIARIGPRNRWPHRTAIAASVVALAVVGAQFAWRLAVAWTLPPQDNDGAAYHLLSVGAFVREHRIVSAPAVVWADVYPKNAELLAAVTTVLDGGRTRLVDGIPLLALPLGLAAVAAAAQWAGRSPAVAWLSGALFAGTPVVLAQATTNYVDSFAAALFLAGWYFIAAGLPVGHRDLGACHRRSLLGGLALGLAAGTKPTMVIGLVLGLAVLTAVVVDAGAQGRLSTPGVGRARRTARFLAAPALLAMATGAPWYVWNVIRFGNPVHPFDVGLGPVVLMRGPSGPGAGVLTAQTPSEVAAHGTVLGTLRVWFREFTEGSTYDSLTGLGAQWWVLVAALAFVIASTVSRRARPSDRLLTFSYLLPIVGVVALAPGVWWARFSHPLVAAGVVALGVSCAELWSFGGARARTLRGVAVVAVGATAALATIGVVRTTAEHRLMSSTVSLRDLVDMVRGDRPSLFADPADWPDYRFARDAGPGTLIAATPAGVGTWAAPLLGPSYRNEVVPLPALRDATEVAAQVAALDRSPDLVVVGAGHEQAAFERSGLGYCLVEETRTFAAFARPGTESSRGCGQWIARSNPSR